MVNKSPSPIEVLVIDDVFGVPGSTFEAKYGELERRDWPYRFHYATAAVSGGYAVEPALRAVNKTPTLAAVLLDIKFGTDDDRLGLAILAKLRALHPLLPIIMLTSLNDDIDALQKAMELGANEYLIKSPSVAELERVLRIYTRPGAQESEHAIWGDAQVMRGLRAQIARVAAGGEVPVLVTGETGTGKELVARAIHRFGRRRSGPFVAKNCAHSDNQLLDAELFGQNKGSFTGAETAAAGLVEQADGGVLFLDEIGSMPAPLQGKLLRLLETKSYRRVGASAERQADFQLVTATNKDLEELIAKGLFAPELYYRIKGVRIQTPSLRAHKEDIPLLIRLFLRRYRQRVGDIYPAERFTDRAVQRLLTSGHAWPGNARELLQIVEACATMTPSAEIDVTDLPPQFSGFTEKPAPSTDETAQIASLATGEGIVLPPDGLNLPLLLARQELGLIRVALQRCNGNKAAVMKLLYPGQPGHYYYRLIYDAVRRAPNVLDEFAEFRSDYEKEAANRQRGRNRRAGQ